MLFTSLCKKNISKHLYLQHLLRGLAHKASLSILKTAYRCLFAQLYLMRFCFGNMLPRVLIYFHYKENICELLLLAYRGDCRYCFINLNILIVPFTYIFHCILFIKNSMDSSLCFIIFYFNFIIFFY